MSYVQSFLEDNQHSCVLILHSQVNYVQASDEQDHDSCTFYPYLRVLAQMRLETGRCYCIIVVASSPLLTSRI